MKRAIAIAALASLVAACGQEQVTPLTVEEARLAMPSPDQATIATPESDAAVSSTGTSALVTSGASALVAASGTSEYAAATVLFSTAVNVSVVWTLRLVEAVVQWPATSCEADTCTWGPGSGTFDVNEYQLVVTKQAERDYLWSLQARKKETTDAFVSIISGEAFTTDRRRVGHGTLVVDMDAAQALNHLSGQPQERGRIEATYDNRTSRKVTAEFLGTQDAGVPSQSVNAAYAFEASGSGGDLQIASRNLDTGAALSLHSRWTATGAGRGDAAFSQGTVAVTRSECWGPSATVFELGYRLTTPDLDGSNTGDVNACGAFTSAVPPTLAAP